MPENPFEEKHFGMDEGHQSQKQVLNGNQKCSMHFFLFLLSLYQNCFIIPSSTYRYIYFFFGLWNSLFHYGSHKIQSSNVTIYVHHKTESRKWLTHKQ